MKKKERKDFQEVVENIQSKLLEGDISAIMRRMNKQQNVMFFKATSKKSWDELTKGEFDVIAESVKYLEEREELIKRAESL